MPHESSRVVVLALKECWHERLLTLCSVLGLAAVLTPLLVFFGIKYGIVTTMTARLIENPRAREIIPVGSGRYTIDSLNGLAALPGVCFLVPQTRQIAATINLSASGPGPAPSLTVELVPTAPDDPLLAQWGRLPPDIGSVVLTERAAFKLGVKAGDRLRGLVGRSRKGRLEQAATDLLLTAVLPAHTSDRESAFVRLDLLEATEDYRDGFAVPALAWPGDAPPQRDQRIYPGFRMYAGSIYQVPALQRLLESRDIEVYTQAAQIETIQSLDRSLNLIFWLVAGVALAGFAASTASRALAEVKRKERNLGIIRLLGFSSSHLFWIPLVQAWVVSVAGAAVAALGYAVVAGLINHLFARYLEPGEQVCRLEWWHLFLAFLFAALVSSLASLTGVGRLAKIEPSEVMRDV